MARKYSNQVLQLIGDKVFSVAAIELCHDRHQLTKGRMLFRLVERLTTNENLNGGNEAEQEIGQGYADHGFDYAVEEAKRYLIKTDAWNKCTPETYGKNWR